ncbi:MAG: hypothetical protein JWL70_240 [Acidimicrobiia bacterium]|nr:hypothetical protein [Acidimicrobiia bacterium]
MRARVVAIALVVAVAGGCGGGDSKASTTTSARSVASADSAGSADTTSVPPSAPTAATAAPTGVTAVRPSTTAGPSAATTAAPVAATDLVDGKIYWGYLSAYRAGPPASLAVDVAEVYFGQQALAEAAKDHAEAAVDPSVDPVMYVRNNNQKTRTFTVKPGVLAVTHGCDYGVGPQGDCGGAKKVPVSKLAVAGADTAGAFVIFVLQGGQISRIEEPYFP